MTDAPAASAAGDPPFTLTKELVIAWLQLAALWALGFAQPLFVILGDSADFLVARGNAWPDTPLVALVMVLVPPTLLVAVEAALFRAPTARRYVHAGFVGLLVAAIVVQFLKEHGNPARRSLSLLALVIGAIAAVAFLRTRFVPALLTVLSPAPLVLLVWFLGLSPVASLAWPVEHDKRRGRRPRPGRS